MQAGLPLADTGPVSYTHLDVYKRQIVDSSICSCVRLRKDHVLQTVFKFSHGNFVMYCEKFSHENKDVIRWPMNVNVFCMTNNNIAHFLAFLLISIKLSIFLLLGTELVASVFI